MKSDRPNTINRDHGRRVYVEDPDKSHMDHMKTVTDFQRYREALEHHSEFKKPYLLDDYPEMEYNWMPPYKMPWWSYPYIPNEPTIGHPDFFDPTKDCLGCAITCYNGYNCNDWGWCHPSISCGFATTNWEIISVVPSDGITETEYGKPLSHCIRFKTDVSHSDDDGKVYIKIKYTDGAGYECFDNFTIKCKEEEEDCCDPTPPGFGWDWDNTDDTIVRNDTAVVTVSGGCPLYNWQITGTGFSLSSAQTTGLSNTVVTDGTACGSADITVTDDCGSVTTGSVRCTESGKWVSKVYCYSRPTNCTLYASGGCGVVADAYQGKAKWHLTGGYQYKVSDPDCPPFWGDWGGNSCTKSPPCGTPEDCATGGGTTYICIARYSNYCEWECL